MKFQIIKVGELIQYLESEKFRNSEIIPITPIRAYSQVKNPRANSNDVALVIAINDKNEIVAYAGALPDYLDNNPGRKIAWSSGWWADPEKGRKASLPVFLKLLEMYNNKMLFSHLSPTTKEILSKLNIADIQTIIGAKAYLKLNLTHQLGSRISWIKKINLFVSLFDALFNFFLMPKLFSWKMKLKKYADNYIEVNTIDEELDSFINNNNQDNVIRRAGEEINWIIKNSWILLKSKPAESIPGRYHFSTLSKNYQAKLFKLMQDGELAGFFFSQIKNGEMRIPYLYYKTGSFNLIVNSIFRECIKRSVHSLVVYQQEIVNYILSNKSPFFYKRQTERFIGSTKTLSLDNMKIQDGDGDCAFT